MDMNKTELVSKINSILSEEFEVPEANILPEASIMDTLDLDSLDIVDIVVLVEKNFGIVMRKEDFKTVTSFESFYNFLASRLGIE